MKEREKWVTPCGPITKCVGLVRGRDGWRAVYTEIQGGVVIKTKNLCEESSKSIALEELKLAVVKKILPSEF